MNRADLEKKLLNKNTLSKVLHEVFICGVLPILEDCRAELLKEEPDIATVRFALAIIEHKLKYR